MRPVRVAAKAVIVQDGRILVTENVDDDGRWYLLPGGGQEPGEALPETLRRECREEAGVDVEVGELLYVRDYIGRHHEYAATDGEVHALELMFACTVRPGQTPGNGTCPDSGQVGVAWLPVAELDRYRLYPKVLRSLIAGLGRDVRPECIYLGDVN
jgi:8-oxo-dGTP diphosphatase